MPPSQEPAGHRYALPSGHRVGDYRIEGFLGAGSFGITYLATDERLGRRVAIKEYLPSDKRGFPGTQTLGPQAFGRVRTHRRFRIAQHSCPSNSHLRLDRSGSVAVGALQTHPIGTPRKKGDSGDDDENHVDDSGAGPRLPAPIPRCIAAQAWRTAARRRRSMRKATPRPSMTSGMKRIMTNPSCRGR